MEEIIIRSVALAFLLSWIGVSVHIYREDGDIAFSVLGGLVLTSGGLMCVWLFVFLIAAIFGYVS